MEGVIIVDSRPKWQQKEDNFYACLTRCECFKKCYLRNYIKCTKNGGTIIPRMRGFKDERILQKYSND